METDGKRLHWTQRLTLVRHGLHVATRTRNFNFFKFIQAHTYVSGIDHVATLSTLLGEDAENIISNLDKFNAVIACVYEDAFKAVYESIKQTARDRSITKRDTIAIYHVDVARHKQLAVSAADKMINMAVTIIEQQPAECQDEAGEVFILGMTFVTDAIEAAITEMDHIEHIIDDFIRLEESWSLVQNSTAWALSAMKGVFNLMAMPASSDSCESKHVRTQSIDGYARSMLRRMSTALSASSTTTPSRKVSVNSNPSRRGSAMSVGSVISPKHATFAAAGIPDAYHHGVNSGSGHTLSPIPPTPADVLNNPFDLPESNAAAYRRNFHHPSSPPLRFPRRQSIAFAPHESQSSDPNRVPFSRTSSNPSPKTERPPLVHAQPSLASFASGASVDSATVFADDPLLMLDRETREPGERQGVLGRISSLLYATPVGEGI